MGKPNRVMVQGYNRSQNMDSSGVPAEVTIGNRVAWKSTPHKGRGIFAVQDIAKGEVIEQSPVTVVPKSETDLFDDAHTGKDSVIDAYLLRWRSDVAGQEYCLGHGFLMLYNHHASPNSALSYDFDNRCISVIATRDIKVGEEVTFDYDCDLWFDFKA